MKGKLRIWNSYVFDILDLDVECVIKELNKLDQLFANDFFQIDEDVVDSRIRVSSRVRQTFHKMKSILRQNLDLS